jgi:hypothetical protein
MILVVDNSANHRARPSHFVSPTKSRSKTECAAALRKYGVASVRDLRKTVTGKGAHRKVAWANFDFPPDTWDKPGPTKGPGIEAVKKALRKHYIDNPKLARSQLEDLLIEEVQPPHTHPLSLPLCCGR